MQPSRAGQNIGWEAGEGEILKIVGDSIASTCDVPERFTDALPIYPQSQEGPGWEKRLRRRLCVRAECPFSVTAVHHPPTVTQPLLYIVFPHDEFCKTYIP